MSAAAGVIIEKRREKAVEAICTLELDDNRCQYLAADKKHCTAVHTECGFCVVAEEKEPVRVTEKWFEKYYRS